MQLTHSYDRLATHSHSLTQHCRPQGLSSSPGFPLLSVNGLLPQTLADSSCPLTSVRFFFQNTHLLFPQSCLKPSVTTYYLAISSNPSTGQILTRDKAYTLKMPLGRKHSKEYLQKRRQVPRKQQNVVKLPTAGIHHTFQRKKSKGTWHDLTEKAGCVILLI